MVPPGGKLVMPAESYYTTRVIATQEFPGAWFASQGITVEMAPTVGSGLRDALDGAAVLWLESPTNPALDVCDIAALAEALDRDRPAGVVDVVPAFASVTVFYDAVHCGGYAHLCAELEARVARTELALVSQQSRSLEIPVCYGGDDGPDLEEVAEVVHHRRRMKRSMNIFLEL